MQIQKLHKEFDKLQKIYGDKNCNAIYGAGQIKNPKICLVFMNPTAKNSSANKNWKGLRAPWIGTKNIWKMLYALNIINKDLYKQIQKKNEWDEKFAKKVYEQIKKSNIYITNLSKATQIDARPLKNEVFKQYLDLFKQEINQVNPKIIITFGNQVSSIILKKPVKVSKYRKKHEILELNKPYKVYPIFYPVGQGMRNMPKAKQDIQHILKV